MGTANHHQRRARVSDMNLRFMPALFFPRFAVGGGIQYIQHRRVDHAHHRFAVLNQGDIHRELAVALDKLFGAIQRINQPVTLPVLAFFPTRRILFGQHRRFRIQLAQARNNDVMCCNIRSGDRRIIALVRDICRCFAVIDLHDCVARLAGKLANLL